MFTKAWLDKAMRRPLTETSTIFLLQYYNIWLFRIWISLLFFERLQFYWSRPRPAYVTQKTEKGPQAKNWDVQKKNWILMNNVFKSPKEALEVVTYAATSATLKSSSQNQLTSPLSIVSAMPNNRVNAVSNISKSNSLVNLLNFGKKRTSSPSSTTQITASTRLSTA